MRPGRRRQRRYTSDEQHEIWRRAKAGERYADIAAAMDTTRAGVRLFLGRSGGIQPRPRQRSARQLSFVEREEISRGMRAGDSARSIARRLGHAASTISRELARNGGRRGYRALAAERRALEQGRRPKVAKLVRQPELRIIVEHLLERRWSPQQIAGWLRYHYPEQPTMQASHETIYQSLFVQSRGALRRELTSYLRRPRVQRRSPQQADGRGRLPDMVNIRERPAEAEDRAVPGHWEGDLLIGSGSHSAIGTLVERQTRFTVLLGLPHGRSAPAVRDALTARIGSLPEQLRRSLTWDQGRELAEHVQFTIDTGVQVYFCDPHSPWQRGSNENTNGLLRQYFPKDMDLSQVSQEQLDAVAAELNGRPRQTLGWMTPSEALAAVLR
jgi:IS30 family transposase